jgi:hypothetical protein
MNSSDQAYCRKLIAKHPDKVSVVAVIDAVGNLGYLDGDLRAILIRQVRKVMLQSDQRTPIYIEKVVTKEVIVERPPASLADYYKNRINRDRKGCKHITNGSVNRQLKPGQPMPDGFRPGRVIRKNITPFFTPGSEVQ